MSRINHFYVFCGENREEEEETRKSCCLRPRGTESDQDTNVASSDRVLWARRLV